MRYAAMAYREFGGGLMYWEFLADTEEEAECVYKDISYDFIDGHYGYTALYRNPEYYKCMEDFMDCVKEGNCIADSHRDYYLVSEIRSYTGNS